MTSIRREIELYPYLKAWLLQDFKNSEPLRAYGRSVEIFVEDVSTAAGGPGGLWSQPDVAAVVYHRGRYVPAWHAELFSFEVKTSAGMNRSAVFEAFGHTRFVNYSFVFWPTRASDANPDLLNLCEEIGVGVLIASDPMDLQTYQIMKSPRRFPSAPQDVDRFIMERFSDERKAAIEAWLDGRGWPKKAASEGQL